jgi:hypothetical protein
MSSDLPKRIPLDSYIERLPPTADGVWVYFAHEDADKSRFKIGSTFRGPELRRFELALGNSQIRLWCAMPGSRKLDCLLKGRFMRDRVDGREIFLTSPWAAYIERLVKMRGGKFW